MISHVLAILTSVIVASAGARPWNLNEYPHLGQISARNREANSVVDTGCGDHIGGADRLCDPDKLLSREEAEAVQSAAVDAQEKVLHDCGGQQQGYQLAVALAKQIQVGRDVAASTETMARGIHDKWGVGNAACNDGVLFFLSRDDRQLFISAGDGARAILSDDHLDAVIERARPLLRQQLLGAAVLQAVTDMSDALAAGTEGQSVLSEPVKAMREAREREQRSSKGSSGGGSSGWTLLFYFSLMAGFFGYAKWRESKQAARLVGWQAARARLLEIDRLQAEVAAQAAAARPPGIGAVRAPAVEAGQAAAAAASASVVRADGVGTAAVRRDDGLGLGVGLAAGPTVSGSGGDDAERARARERSLQRRRNAKDGRGGAGTAAGGQDPRPADDGDDDDADDFRGSGGGAAVALLSSTASAAAPGAFGAASSASSSASAGSAGSPSSSAASGPPPLAAQMACCPICLDDLPVGAGVPSAAVDAARGQAAATESGAASSAAAEAAAAAVPAPAAGAGSGAAAPGLAPAGGFGAGTAVTLACQHRFHLGCLDEWFGGQGKTRCPICRTTAYTADGRLPTAEEIDADRRRGPDAPDGAAGAGGGGGAGGGVRPLPLRPLFRPQFHHYGNYGGLGGGANAAGYTAEGLHAMRPIGPDRMDGGATGGLAQPAPPQAAGVGGMMHGVPGGLHDNRADVNFLLQRLQARYPEYVPDRLVDGWRQQAGLGAAGAPNQGGGSAAAAPAAGGAGAAPAAADAGIAGPRVGQLASDPAFLAAMPALTRSTRSSGSSSGSWSGGFSSGGSFGGGFSSGGRGGGW